MGLSSRKKNSSRSSLTAFGAVALLAGVGVISASPVLQAATELARVNSTVITLEDFSQKYRENSKFFQLRAPSKKDMLDDLIKRELAIQEARKAGLDKDPEIVDRMNTVLYQALLDRKLGKEFDAIQVSDEEAKNHYAKNPEIRSSHIFVEVPTDAKPEDEKKARAKIQDIQAKLKDGKKSFAEIAQTFSEGSAAPMGGDIDYQTRDRLPPGYYDAALALKTVGKVSDVVRTPFGFHVIKLTAIRPWEETDKNQVRRELVGQKRTQIFEKYMAGLRKGAKVSQKPELLKD